MMYKILFFRCLIGAVITLLTAGLVQAGPYEDALDELYADGLTANAVEDYATALSAFRAAADAGNIPAQAALSFMYSNGNGVQRDDQQAYFWWILSNVRGDTESVKRLSKLESLLSTQQRANAQAKARGWKPSTHSVRTKCKKFGAEGSSCNECFTANGVYQGQSVANLYLDFNANSKEETVILANDPGTVATKYIQNGFLWTSNIIWELNSKVFTDVSPTRGAYVYMEPGQEVKEYLVSKPGTGLGFVSGPSSGGSREVPSFLLQYKTTFYTKSKISEPKSNLSCVFLYSNWCGDGVRDTKEQCDLGSQNGSNGSKCSSTCRSN